jgi:hypothetical protein
MLSISTRGTDTSQGEALPAGRNDGRYVRRSIGQRLQICDHGIATVPQPGIHHGAAVVDETLVGEDLG